MRSAVLLGIIFLLGAAASVALAGPNGQQVTGGVTQSTTGTQGTIYTPSSGQFAGLPCWTTDSPGAYYLVWDPVEKEYIMRRRDDGTIVGTVEFTGGPPPTHYSTSTGASGTVTP